MKSKKGNYNLIISFGVVIVWMIVIFLFSNMNTVSSNGASKGMINIMVDVGVRIADGIGVLDSVPNEQERLEFINDLNRPMRKVMHFMVYLVLAVLILYTLKNRRVKNKGIITLVICILYAMTDEYHQTFIRGRTGQFMDVLIDTLGASIGILVFNRKKTE